MPQSLANIILHTVFSTKNRTPFFNESSLRDETHCYLGGVAKTLNCQPLIVGGWHDHVHMLTALSRTLSVADFIKEVKRISGKWVRNEKGIAPFKWQAGYGVFSVSGSRIATVRKYIVNQDEHHGRMTFQEEFRAFLRKHGIEFDERYVWD